MCVCLCLHIASVCLPPLLSVSFGDRAELAMDLRRRRARDVHAVVYYLLYIRYLERNKWLFAYRIVQPRNINGEADIERFKLRIVYEVCVPFACRSPSSP